MIAGGQQSGFNWNGIALGALGGAVAGGVTSALAPAAAGATSGAGTATANGFQTAVLQGTVRSVVTQGLGIATGLQDRFDWKGLAASAIASGIGYGAGQAVGSAALDAGYSAGVSKFASGVAGGLSAGAVSALVRGESLNRNLGAIAADAVATTVGNMVVDQVQGASLAKSTSAPTRYEDAVYGQLVDAFGSASHAGTSNPYASRGMLFAGPGAPSPVDDPVEVEIPLGPERSGLVYGAGYGGALSQWMPSGLIDSTQIDLNAAAFRSSLNAAPSSWDALTQQADARIAAGTYDRFSDLGHAIVDDGSLGQRVERFAHALSYTRPDAAEQIAAFRAPPNMTAATFDTMLSSPLAGIAGGLMYASGRSGRDAYLAATIAGSAEGIAAGAAGFQMPTAPLTSQLAAVRRSSNALPAQPLEVGTYSELAQRSIRDGLSPDHIPSFAAIRTKFEADLGRPLTPTEATKLRNETNTLMIDTEIHQQASRTYGGRNTTSQIAQDATDLGAAARRDQAALQQRLLNEGYTR